MQILSNPMSASSARESSKFWSIKGNRGQEHDSTSDSRPEVEIWPFRACAMKNMQYNPYLWPNRRNLRVVKKIGVEEHDGDVRF